MEKVPAGGRISSLNPDHLKPMRKRKRKEYLSPSDEDSDMEGQVEQQSVIYSSPFLWDLKVSVHFKMFF